MFVKTFHRSHLRRKRLQDEKCSLVFPELAMTPPCVNVVGLLLTVNQ